MTIRQPELEKNAFNRNVLVDCLGSRKSVCVEAVHRLAPAALSLTSDGRLTSGLIAVLSLGALVQYARLASFLPSPGTLAGFPLFAVVVGGLVIAVVRKSLPRWSLPLSAAAGLTIVGSITLAFFFWRFHLGAFLGLALVLLPLITGEHLLDQLCAALGSRTSAGHFSGFSQSVLRRIQDGARHGLAMK